MSRRGRFVVFFLAAAGVGVLLALAFVQMPHFGGSTHPYRDRAVAAAVAHATANAVSSVNFDQRGLDTLGEESILLGSVVGAAALLRPSSDEEERRVPETGQVLEATQFLGYALLPVSLIIGADVVVHGHLTPGGGFQGGVVLATGLHLLYVTGSYRALERIRPLTTYEYGEALGSGAFASLGIAGIGVAGAFLANIIPQGKFGQLISAGTVPVLNIAVGLAVVSGVVVLLAAFLDQEIIVAKPSNESDEDEDEDEDASR